MLMPREHFEFIYYSFASVNELFRFVSSKKILWCTSSAIKILKHIKPYGTLMSFSIL